MRIALLTLLPILPIGAAGPVAVTPLPVTPSSTPFLAEVLPLGQLGYTETEYAVAGTVNVYEYNAAKQLQVKTPNVAYTTRLLVRRPADPRRFNGIAVFEWMNPSAGYDLDFMWQATREVLMNEGYVWVGLTVRPVAVNRMKSWNATRYAALSMPDAGVIYEAAGQIAALLRDSAASANPLRGWPVRFLLGTGYSQSGRYLVTYINEFHRAAQLAGGTPVFDGYLVSGSPGNARQINSTTPDSTDERRFINAPVPVIRIQTETDLVALASAAARKPDSALYRSYEVAGTSHADDEILRLTSGPGSPAGRDLPSEPLPACENAQNPISFAPFQRFGLTALVRWVRGWGAPPPSEWLQLDSAGVILRDSFGNALGGVRPPGVEAPLGQHEPVNSGASPACILSGSYFAFPAGQVQRLYSNRGTYVSKVVDAVNQLTRAGFLLSSDATDYKRGAARQPLP